MGYNETRQPDAVGDSISASGSSASPSPFGRLSRRALLRRAAVLGASTPIVAGLLAACGGSSSSSKSSSSSSSSASSTGATPAGSTATASATTPVASPAASSPTSLASPSASPTGSPQASTGSVTTGGPGTVTKYKVEPVGKTGGKMIYGSPSDAKTLLSVITTDGPSFTVIDMIFEALTQSNPDNTDPIAWLAKSWEISADGINYTFTLQDGVKWQDGTPLTANDVKFTYELVLNPATKSSFTSDLDSKLKSMNVVDDTHITFTLKAPNASFLAISTTTGYEIVPQHILKDVAPAKLASDPFTTGQKGRTIGTGPFLFQEWVKDDHVLVVKNPNYWGGAPALDQWFYKVVPSSAILTQQLRTGDVDYGAIQPADYDSMKKQSNITVTTYDTFGFEFYGYNLDPAKTTLFQEREVRQALLYALNRQQMLSALNFGLGTVADTTIPVLSWAYDPSAIKVNYNYDPSKAESMLDAAGWKKGSDGIRAKNGKQLAFNINTSPITQVFVDYAQAMQQEWAKIGVKATVKSEEWNAFLTRITGTHDFDIFIVGFGWFADPDESLMWPCDAYNGGFNLFKYCNPQVDKLLKQGLLTTDHAKRQAIYNEVQNIIETDLPAPTLYLGKGIAGVNNRLHNLFPNAVNQTWDITKWWVG